MSNRSLSILDVRAALNALRDSDIEERDFYVSIHPDRVKAAGALLPPEAFAYLDAEGRVVDVHGNQLVPLPGFDTDLDG